MSYINRPLINGIYQGTNWAPNTNTKAYWPLNYDILDYSGNNKHLTDAPLFDSPETGSTVPQVIVGKFGNARYFNGTTSLLWYDGNCILTDMSQFTVSMWCLKNGNGLMFNNGNGGQGFAFGHDGSQVYGLANGVGWLNGSGALWPATTWNNVIITRGAGVITMYCNGVAGGNTFGTTPNTPTSGYTTIGGTYGQGIGWMFMAGSVCEVIMEDVCWQPADVLTYYNSLK